MPDNGVILVVTDAGTKQRELEEAIKKKSAEKNIKIFIVFSPKCLATELCSESMPSYNRVSEGRIFNQTDFDSEEFFKSVVYTVRTYPQMEYAIANAYKSPKIQKTSKDFLYLILNEKKNIF